MHVYGGASSIVFLYIEKKGIKREVFCFVYHSPLSLPQYLAQFQNYHGVQHSNEEKKIHVAKTEFFLLISFCILMREKNLKELKR